MAKRKRVLNEDDFIQEGANPAPGVLILACTVGDDYDSPQNRVLVRLNDVWVDFTTAGEAVLSVDAGNDGIGYVLGENASVVRFDWRTATAAESLRASRSLITNPRALQVGPLRRIRIIGGRVFSAGSAGQVYELRRNAFAALPSLEFDGEALTTEDISGSGPKDLIAVTSDGIAALFNGSRWQDLDLPTNASFTSICRLDDGTYAIAAKSGTVVLGRPGRWNVLDPIDEERNYWGVAERDGVIYVSHLGGIDVIQGTELVPLEIRDKADLEFTVLRSGPDGVWSFAGQTIGLITAEGWRTALSRSA